MSLKLCRDLVFPRILACRTASHQLCALPAVRWFHLSQFRNECKCPSRCEQMTQPGHLVARVCAMCECAFATNGRKSRIQSFVWYVCHVTTLALTFPHRFTIFPWMLLPFHESGENGKSCMQSTLTLAECSNLNYLFLLFSLSFFARVICSEENVWKLCEQVRKTRPTELAKCYAVYVSNEGRTVPLWRQKAGRGDDKVVIWVRNSILNLKK